MKTNYSKTKIHSLVHQCHDALKASGANPCLNDVRHELLRLHSLDLTETEVGRQMAKPLESGKRGTSGTSSKADSASRRASLASQNAEQNPATHCDACEAHKHAADLHRAAAQYHDTQADHHDACATKAGELVPVDCANAAPPMRSRLSDEGGLQNVLQYMPAGIHTITPSQGGRPVIVTVEVNEESADRLETQRRALEAAGGKPFFSIQHNTQIAAFWPTKFFWDTRLDATGSLASGVWAEGTWTKSGREAVEGRDFRTFSPTFFVNAMRNDPENPVQVMSNPAAKLNMGALENDPAFQSISPLWNCRA